MNISIIVAMDLDRGIGYQGRVPWHLPSDLRRFKKLTMGHHIIMGRKTFESIGKALPGRISVVLSRNLNWHHEGCVVVSSLTDALTFVEKERESEAFIIGGGDVFSQTVNIVKRMYLTIVQMRFVSDVKFPEIEESEWREIYREEIPKSNKDPYETVFRVLERF